MNKQEMDGWRDFLNLCIHQKTTDHLEALFDLFLTIEEKNDLAKRFLIVKALIEGALTQRQIAEELGVSISKITRGSNALKMIDRELRRSLEKNLK